MREPSTSQHPAGVQTSGSRGRAGQHSGGKKSGAGCSNGTACKTIQSQNFARQTSGRLETHPIRGHRGVERDGDVDAEYWCPAASATTIGLSEDVTEWRSRVSGRVTGSLEWFWYRRKGECHGVRVNALALCAAPRTATFSRARVLSFASGSDENFAMCDFAFPRQKPSSAEKVTLWIF